MKKFEVKSVKPYEQKDIFFIDEGPESTLVAFLVNDSTGNSWCSRSGCEICIPKVRAANDRVKFYRETLSE